MAKLYGDEDFDRQVIETLRSLGHDVLTVQEAGRGNQRIADADVLAFAVSQERAVLTFNRRDFINLHRQSPLHRGILVCTRDANINALATRIHQALTDCSDLSGQLLRINRPRTS